MNKIVEVQFSFCIKNSLAKKQAYLGHTVSVFCIPSGMQGCYQGEQLPQYAPQQQTQATSIHPASQPGGL